MTLYELGQQEGETFIKTASVAAAIRCIQDCNNFKAESKRLGIDPDDPYADGFERVVRRYARKGVKQ